MAELTYEKWLDDELEKARKKQSDQEMSYQETGNKRYYDAMVRAEYLEKALRSAERSLYEINNRVKVEMEMVEANIRNLPDDGEFREKVLQFFERYQRFGAKKRG